MGIDTYGCVGVSIDDDFLTGTLVELEDDVKVDAEKEVTELPLSLKKKKDRMQSTKKVPLSL